MKDEVAVGSGWMYVMMVKQGEKEKAALVSTTHIEHTEICLHGYYRLITICLSHQTFIYTHTDTQMLKISEGREGALLCFHEMLKWLLAWCVDGNQRREENSANPKFITNPLSHLDTHTQRH